MPITSFMVIVPAQPRAARGRWIAVAAGIVAVVMVVAAAAVVVAVGNRVRWDPRIEPLARFVEEQRGAPFLHDVPVEFHSDAEYARLGQADTAAGLGALVASAAAGGAPTDRAWAAWMRALGYASGDLDAGAVGAGVHDESAGYFDPTTESIHVREGGGFGLGTRLTLVHELTHAYDFQRFELGSFEPATAGQDFAFRAVVEGSATFMEWAYLESVGDREADAYRAQAAAEADARSRATPTGGGLPPTVLETFEQPYALGPLFIEAVRQELGATFVWEAVDRALRHLPASEEHIARPSTYLDGDAVATVPPPPLREGEVAGDDSGLAGLGQLSLAMMLAPRVGADRAWDSVRGWQGDAVTAYRKGAAADAPRCVRAVVTFEGPPARDAFATALHEWARGLGSASVASGGSDPHVVLDACDPGPGGPPVREADPSVTDAVYWRQVATNSLRDDGLDEAKAECAVATFFGRLGTARVAELEGLGRPWDAGAPGDVAAAAQAVATGCGVPAG